MLCTHLILLLGVNNFLQQKILAAINTIIKKTRTTTDATDTPAITAVIGGITVVIGGFDGGIVVELPTGSVHQQFDQ